MDGLKPRIKVPTTARPGEVMEIRTLISHPMETGYRRDARGNKVPRHIIERFTCEYSGRVVFEAEFGPGIAANPYLAFFVEAVSSGPITFTWRDDRGESWQVTKQIKVESS